MVPSHKKPIFDPMNGKMSNLTTNSDLARARACIKFEVSSVPNPNLMFVLHSRQIPIQRWYYAVASKLGGGTPGAALKISDWQQGPINVMFRIVQSQ